MKVTGTGRSTTDIARDVGGSGAATSVSNSKEKRRTSIAPQIESGVSDNVAISSKAKNAAGEAALARDVAKSSPDIDDAKVARLKAAIQNGSYKVDADKIADKLVDEHLATIY